MTTEEKQKASVPKGIESVLFRGQWDPHELALHPRQPFIDAILWQNTVFRELNDRGCLRLSILHNLF